MHLLGRARSPCSFSAATVAGSSASPANTMLAPPARQLRAVLEQAPRSGACTRLQLGGQRGRRTRRVSAKPQKRAKLGEPSRIVGQRLRLLVGDHLQAVLDACAGRRRLRSSSSRDLALDPAALGEPAQRLQRLRHAQLRLAPAGDQLLGLHEELDLADAAAAELDVVAGDRDRAEAAKGVDLPLHGVDVGDGGEVEVLAPDEGRELVEELAPGVDVAGARRAP